MTFEPYCEPLINVDFTLAPRPFRPHGDVSFEPRNRKVVDIEHIDREVRLIQDIACAQCSTIEERANLFADVLNTIASGACPDPVALAREALIADEYPCELKPARE